MEKKSDIIVTIKRWKAFFDAFLNDNGIESDAVLENTDPVYLACKSWHAGDIDTAEMDINRLIVSKINSLPRYSEWNAQEIATLARQISCVNQRLENFSGAPLQDVFKGGKPYLAWVFFEYDAPPVEDVRWMNLLLKMGHNHSCLL